LQRFSAGLTMVQVVTPPSLRQLCSHLFTPIMPDEPPSLSIGQKVKDTDSGDSE
jgi:hypothetical protein